MSDLKSLFDLPSLNVYTPKGLAKTDIWTITSKEVVGIEVEAEDVKVGPSNAVWQMTEDGSLRNAGREFITRPIPAMFAPDALANLLLNSNFCFSPRTSVHVHVNCMNIETHAILNMVYLYALYEKTFFRFVGRSRWKNIYCTPITDTNLMYNLGRHGVKAPWEKYTGLNLIPLSQHGTLEFRHMHGTTDVKKLSIWIDLITRLKEYVMAHPTGEIRKRINAFGEADVVKLAQEIWGDLTGQLNISDPEEILGRVPIVKLAMLDVTKTNYEQTKRFNDNAIFFKV